MNYRKNGLWVRPFAKGTILYTNKRRKWFGQDKITIEQQKIGSGVFKGWPSPGIYLSGVDYGALVSK